MTKKFKDTHESKVLSFIRGLTKFDPGANVFNPWKDQDPDDAVKKAHVHRAERLCKHFMLAKPRVVLIGEAPGYAGCHFSGIPFTSERNIVNGQVPRVTHHQRITTGKETTWSEASSTIVWNALHEWGLAEHAVLWNAYPFHPHEPGNLRSNRTPTVKELRDGIPFLEQVMELSLPAKVVTIGEKAREMFSALYQPPAASLRHPANGGAAEFRQGVRWLAMDYLGMPRKST